MTSFIGPNAPSRATQTHTRREVRRVECGATFEEEREEVLASVLESLGTEASDPDRTAACYYLLRHLTKPQGAASCR